MRKDILNRVVVIGMALALGSCTPKLVVTAPPAVDKVAVSDEKAENLKTLATKELAYETLVLKGKAQMNVNGEENDVTLNIRIKKDETIWFSVTALGGAIEAARGMITPDSILLMNRLQKTVVRKPFSYVHSYTNAQVNFGWLQAILTGNNIKELMTEKSALMQENGVWLLSGTQQKLAYRVLFNTFLKTASLTLNDAAEGQGLKVDYDKYTVVPGGIFPSNVQISSAVGNKKISVTVEFVKIDHNVAVEFPFTVPKSFELIR